MVPAVATRSLSCEERRAVLIAGPTASGKSRAALAIARAFGGVSVINADAMQCYRELKILTARPSDADAAQVPHRLYGHRRAAEPWSAGIFADEAAAEIAARARRSLPVIAGGTGLYLRALERGPAPFPPIPDMVRRCWREALRRDGVAALHARLTPEDRLAIWSERPAAGLAGAGDPRGHRRAFFRSPWAPHG